MEQNTILPEPDGRDHAPTSIFLEREKISFIVSSTSRTKKRATI